MNFPLSSFLGLAATFLLLPAMVSAELIIFENGDQLRGTIVTLDAKELKLQNPNVGLVTISREKVASIVLKESPGTSLGTTLSSQSGLKPPTTTNDPVAQLRQGIDPKMLEQVQNQFLGAAGPEANAMFNEMLSGLVSGQLNLNDLRNQARTTLDELKKMENELDEEDTAMLSMYSGILERFIAQGTNSTNRATTNAVPNSTRKPALNQSSPGKPEFRKPPRRSEETNDE